MKRFSLATAVLSCAVLFLTFCGLQQARAQQATTSLRGAVTDASGAILPGATVTLTRAATGQILTATTNPQGEYQFLRLAPGEWTVKVTAKGFGSQTKAGNLLVSKPATINFQMTVQEVSQTVNVSAETETLNTTDATLGNAVGNATIKALPMISRNVPDLLSLQPGVLYLGHQSDQTTDSKTNESRSGVVNGVRSDQGNVTMDGLDNNDQKNGYAFTGVLRETLDSIQEFRVTTGMADPDQGRSAGAQVTLVTKGGTNQFHGAVYEYNRNTNTSANDWFIKNAQAASDLPNKPPKYIQNVYGADLGGPILHNKLFFFANYEGNHLRENQTVVQETPTNSLKAGNIIYPSNGNNVTLTPAQIATMDPNCTANGTCPWGPGVDPHILALLQGYPTANGSALGDGVNLGSFTFSSPYPQNLNTTIARLDWSPSSRQQLFLRGNLQDDTLSDVIQFPGQPPSHTTRDNTKGIAAGYIWTITNNLVSDLRYGYTRQGYARAGLDCGSYIQTLRTVSSPTAESCSTTVHVPVQNIVYNMSWTHGEHTLSYGIDYRGVTNYSQTNNNSYGYGSLNIQWLADGGAIGNAGTTPAAGSLNPGGFGLPPVDSSDYTNYSQNIGLLTGLIPYVQGQFNFKVAPDGQSGSTIAEGVPLALTFRSNEFEYYIQDQWRIRPNLTVTVGIRHSLLQPPYETHGQQVQPTIDTHQWFADRVAQAKLGIADQPDLAFSPGGKAHNKPSYWNMQKANIAPRIAVAYSPDSKTSIRAGVGMFFDHFGQGIVDTFAQYGSFGLQTQISNPATQYSVDNAPRFTSLTSIPPLQGVTIPSVIQYPYTPPNTVNTGMAITWGVDNRIKTPYTEAVDFSIQRELPHNFTVEADYVGTFGRHLLTQLDLAEPLDLVDPKSGMDYFQAGKLLAQATYAGQTTVSPIPYWEDMFPWLATGGMTATQNIYTNLYSGLAAQGNDSLALADLDAYCSSNLGCGPLVDGNGNVTTRYYQRQFSSLYAWSSIGTSSYNGLQLSLRRVTDSGISMNFSYTYSKAIDMGSDTERASEFTTAGGSGSYITNSFNPKGAKAVSDYDVRHLLTGHFVYQLPFGHGRRFAATLSRPLDAVVGGWTLSGITRFSSGLPFSIVPPLGYATNYQQPSYAVVTGKVKVHKHIVGGLPQVFADPDALNNGIATGSPIRFAYPGEEGSRNAFRGDGYFEQDASLAKSWRIYREQTLRFAWEVFNVPNSVRFNDSSITSLGGLNVAVTSGSSFGTYASQLVQSRKQQFSLRYDF